MKNPKSSFLRVATFEISEIGVLCTFSVRAFLGPPSISGHVGDKVLIVKQVILQVVDTYMDGRHRRISFERKTWL